MFELVVLVGSFSSLYCLLPMSNTYTYSQVTISKLYYCLPQTSLSAGPVSLLIHLNSHYAAICFLKHWLNSKSFPLNNTLCHFHYYTTSNELHRQKSSTLLIYHEEKSSCENSKWEFLHICHAGHVRPTILLKGSQSLAETIAFWGPSMLRGRVGHDSEIQLHSLISWLFNNFVLPSA